MGLVKTRLAREVGEDQALVAYRGLLATTADQVRELQLVTVCFTPADGEAEVRPFFPESWNFRAQRGADLGARLRNALAASFRAGSERVAVIGVDCPYLDGGDVAEAWKALDTADVVFGPAEDGGYWLIAMKKLHSGLFAGIEWGTGAVLGSSLAQAKRLRLEVHLLRQLRDIDTAADWRQFLEACDSGSRVSRTVRNFR
jgi:rSAM/selenodomain-associated transferase 1